MHYSAFNERRPKYGSVIFWVLGILAVIVVIIIIFMLWSLFSPTPDSKRIEVHLYSPADQDKPWILFVHGIGGSGDGTWRNEAGLSYMDLMHDNFPGFGIASVEYDTRIVGKTDTIEQVAERLAEFIDTSFTDAKQLVIISHSMGGLISRLAVCKSEFRKRESQFLTHISLSTPYLGSKLPKPVKGLYTSDQLKELAPNSTTQNLCADLWQNLCDEEGSRIKQFAGFETEKTSGSPVLVVEEVSATHLIENDNVYKAKNSDHYEICDPYHLSSGMPERLLSWIKESTGYREIRGKHHYEDDIILPPGSITTIKAGSALTFADGVIVNCKGLLRIEGTKDNPVSIVFSGGLGGILLHGKWASDSTFAHTSFTGGGGIPLNWTNAKYEAPALREDLYGGDVISRDEEAKCKGGVLSIVLADDVTISDCNFSACHSYVGGAFLAAGSHNVRVSNSEFTGNQSEFGGGAIWTQYSNLTIENCVFDSNQTGVEDAQDDDIRQFACGGAVYIGAHTLVRIDNSAFNGNKAASAGGAIYLFDTSLYNSGSSTLANCIFSNNIAHTKKGGALFVDGKSKLHVAAAKFYDNLTPSSLVGNHVWDESAGVVVGRPNMSTVKIEKSEFNPPQDVRRGIHRLGTLLVQQSPIRNSQAFERREERKVDTIVIHHISAINWGDEEFQEAFQEEIRRFETEQNTDTAKAAKGELKYDAGLCKEILELYGVSAHYLIDRDGNVFQLVQDKDVAYHAGKSKMPEPDGRESVNEFSLGIELISSHPDDDPEVRDGLISAYTDFQYDSLHELLVRKCLEHGVEVSNVVGHDKIAGRDAVSLGLRQAEQIKKDPGPLFDWVRVKSRLIKSLGVKRLQNQPSN